MKRGLNPEDTRTIKRHFIYLKDELDMEVLKDHLVALELLDDDQVNEIECEGPRRKQVDLLLRTLLRRPASCYEKFLNILEEVGYKHVREKLKAAAKPLELKRIAGLALEDMRDRIFNHRHIIVDQLEPLPVLEFFVMYDVIDMDDYETIIGEKSRAGVATALIGYIEHCLHSAPDTYCVLILALEADECGAYLLNVLNQAGSDSGRYAAGDRNVSVQVKQKSGKLGPLRRVLGNKITLTLSLKRVKNRRPAEEDVVELLRRNLHHINDELVRQTGLQIAGIRLGSIVIYLQNCGNNGFHTVEDLISKPGLTNILEAVFSQPGVMERLSKVSEMAVTVVQEQQQNAVQTRVWSKARTDVKENLKRNIPHLLEEVDALRFVKELQKGEILTPNEVDRVLNTEPVSRRDRLSRLFQILLEKGDRAVNGFVEVLRNQNKTDLVRRLDPSSVTEEDSLEDVDDLLRNYPIIVEELSPRDVINDAIGRGVLTPDFKTSCDDGRRDQTMQLLQLVLREDSENKRLFCQVLQDNGYCLSISTSDDAGKGDGSKPSSLTASSTSSASPQPGILFTGKVVITQDKKDTRTETIPERGRTVGNIKKINPNDSGYSSNNDLNFTVSAFLEN